jgi:hypothetical protein
MASVAGRIQARLTAQEEPRGCTRAVRELPAPEVTPCLSVAQGGGDPPGFT